MAGMVFLALGETDETFRRLEIVLKNKEWWATLLKIHPWLVPALHGARRYHRGFERGVKLTGATRHYVT